MGPVRSWRWIGLLLSLIAAAAARGQEDRVLDWVEDVILGTEYGGAGSVCARWVRTPSLSIMEGTTAEQGLIADCVREVNGALARTPIREIRLDRPKNPGADILVYAVPLDRFATLARKHGFTYVEGNLGYFWIFWNERYEIRSAVVLLASDRLRGERLRHVALEEITQTLGLAGDSPLFRESIFFGAGEDGGTASALSARDRQLIEFVYRRLKPGDRTAEVRIAFWRHWGRD